MPLDNEWMFEKEIPREGTSTVEGARGKALPCKGDIEYIARMCERGDVRGLLLGTWHPPLAHPLLGWVRPDTHPAVPVCCFCLGRGLVILLGGWEGWKGAHPALPAFSVVKVAAPDVDVRGYFDPRILRAVPCSTVDRLQAERRGADRLAYAYSPHTASLVHLSQRVRESCTGKQPVWETWRLHSVLVEQVHADPNGSLIPSVTLAVPSFEATQHGRPEVVDLSVRLFPCGVAVVMGGALRSALRLPVQGERDPLVSVPVLPWDVLILQTGRERLMVGYSPRWGCMDPPEIHRYRGEG